MILLAVDKNKEAVERRLAIMGAFGFFQGASLGPLIQATVQIDPSIIMTAFLGTTCCFVCFTVTSLLANRRQILLLGGVLSSAFSVVCSTCSLIGAM